MERGGHLVVVMDSPSPSREGPIGRHSKLLTVTAISMR